MVEVFGEAVGKHARSALGMAELPFGIPVEIEMGPGSGVIVEAALLKRLRLSDSKEGASVRAVGLPVVDLLPVVLNGWGG
jgi:hypothetical protein